jgi:DNA topoisomerase VI subunit B
MALRTFHANPSLGGFGNESSNAQLWLDRTGTTTTPRSKNDEPVDGDAFAQIIKELVDNAVDACLSSKKEDSSPKRVRVDIQPTKEDEHLLRVTVTDNGCGMHDIQACVDPFRTSKQDTESNTAGRYGIGLTLCLLHAQRLVRGSCAVIRSATAQQTEWTTLQCVVDADQDKIQCTTRISGHQPKDFVQESGTCVSLLVRVRSCVRLPWAFITLLFRVILT